MFTHWGQIKPYLNHYIVNSISEYSPMLNCLNVKLIYWSKTPVCSVVTTVLRYFILQYSKKLLEHKFSFIYCPTPKLDVKLTFKRCEVTVYTPKPRDAH